MKLARTSPTREDAVHAEPRRADDAGMPQAHEAVARSRSAVCRRSAARRPRRRGTFGLADALPKSSERG